jgi:fatty acid desaturase
VDHRPRRDTRGEGYRSPLALGVSYLLVLAIAVPTAGFLVRTFILFLGRRGGGDVRTLTVAEYTARPWRGRMGYRLFRNPLVMFGIGPIVALIVAPRLVSRSARPRMRRSVIGTNIALAVLVGMLCWLVGWRDYLMVQAPNALLAGSAGIWLFYVQHQFEDTNWQSADIWSYADAALRGSSYLKLPRVLQFFSGNIGLHHIHHLSARIPNYNLQRAHDENPIFHQVPTLSLWDGLRAVRFTRLLSRFVPGVQARQCVAWHCVGTARLLPVPALAPRACDPPRHIRRP